MAGNYYQILNKAATQKVELDNNVLLIVDDRTHQEIRLEPQEVTELCDFLLKHMEAIHNAAKR